MSDQKTPEDASREKRSNTAEQNPAGPHAKPELTNEDATPGAGSLPDAGQDDADGGTG
ncbi:hypothetical protein [Mangrovicella endophytica]|uniref:hypothetical protein n=1 Tax=Mangrovicella endophytica TaxID=2066697 RepID=UPI0018E43E9F|nr:hypothetical protein [Mangrovicella endophytica]